MSHITQQFSQLSRNAYSAEIIMAAAMGRMLDEALILLNDTNPNDAEGIGAYIEASAQLLNITRREMLMRQCYLAINTGEAVASALTDFLSAGLGAANMDSSTVAKAIAALSSII